MTLQRATLIQAIARQVQHAGSANLTADYRLVDDRDGYAVVDILGERYEILSARSSAHAVQLAFQMIYGAN